MINNNDAAAASDDDDGSKVDSSLLPARVAVNMVKFTKDIRNIWENSRGSFSERHLRLRPNRKQERERRKRQMLEVQ